MQQAHVFIEYTPEDYLSLGAIPEEVVLARARGLILQPASGLIHLSHANRLFMNMTICKSQEDLIRSTAANVGKERVWFFKFIALARNLTKSRSYRLAKQKGSGGGRN